MRPSRNQVLIEALAVEVKARRLEIGYTQEDLAAQCNIDRPFISLIEVGKKQPTISVLYALCGALQFSFGEFAARIEMRYQKQLRADARRLRK
jgi:transcriptional regulator with XRE-family HTH domain